MERSPTITRPAATSRHMGIRAAYGHLLFRSCEPCLRLWYPMDHILRASFVYFAVPLSIGLDASAWLLANAVHRAASGYLSPTLFTIVTGLNSALGGQTAEEPRSDLGWLVFPVHRWPSRSAQLVVPERGDRYRETCGDFPLACLWAWCCTAQC